ncbi:MAG TPA: Uma2 family endonuclease [Longimicrobium sp.]|jgi:Uma2 family endonuclease
MAVQFVQPHRFSADQYRRMTEIGVVPENGTELIDGVVVAGTRPFRFTSEDYFRLGREGILDEDERVELLDGEIIQMTPIGSRHSSVVARLTRLLVARAGAAEVRIQDVLHLRDGREPQPDAAVYRAPGDAYETRHPVAEDALLVVEVADSSLLHDRTVKAEHYAEAGIPEYWLVDLKRDVVIVARNPVGMEFMDVREYRRGEAWVSPALGAGEVRADDVLGPARG